MSPLLSLRTSLACALIFTLFVTGLISITTHESHASNNSLPRSLTPTVREPSEETAPQTKTVDEATRTRVSQAFGKLPLSFEENRGQVDNEVKYISRGSGYTLFLTPTEAVLTLRKVDKVGRHEKQARDLSNPQSARSQASVLRMKLRGANSAPVVTGESEMGVKTNYFKGNDPQKWHTDVARYERVRYRQVYPGIDMIYYGQQQQLEYDFEVAPGVDARQIALEFTGVKRVKVERGTGDLLLKTTSGEVRQRKPVAYQEVGGARQEVKSRYIVKGKRRVGIEVGEYDRTKRLIIDPVLNYSTYLGGNDGDDGQGIAVDASGHVYVTGLTYSTDFPTLNQYQIDNDPNDSDVFVTKLDTNASGAASLLYSTYLGGSDYDEGYGIAVDASGHAYVTGLTYSTDFPTHNQYQTRQGDLDVFVTKLDTNASGEASLLYSTYLGGSSEDQGYGIAVDASGNVYVTGITASYDFPTFNQYQTEQGDWDAFVTKLDTNASGTASLLYSTYLGGSDYDEGYGIAVDASDHAYVTGLTYSTDFPTLNQYQTNQGGGADAFVTKLDTNASGEASLLYSTHLGGSDINGNDYGFGIAVDASGYAYVTGYTEANDFPTFNQYQTYRRGSHDAFVTKLDTNALGEASLLYSTYLGGSINDVGYGIAVDASGHVYVTGVTSSTDFPTLNQYQTDQGDVDAFVTKLDTNASGTASLLYSTYLGGSDYEVGYGIAVDASGHAYVTGFTKSANFPTLHQYQTDQSYGEAFVTKLADTTIISGRVTSNGTIGINRVTVTLGGSQSRTAITNATGNYSFLNLPIGGDYTVTPTRSDLTFIPLEQSFTNLHANQTHVDFTTQPITISGKVTTETADGAGLAGVTVTLTDGAGFTPRTLNTASDGTYSFTDVPAPGNYKIKPTLTNYNFGPTQLVLYNVTENQTNTNFVATLKSYTVSGVVKLGAAGLSGVTVKLSSPTPAGFTTRTTTTSSTGAYSFTNVPAIRDYTVTPTKTGYQFTPMNKSLTNLSANQAVNFLVKVYSIIGRITRTGTTTGISAVTVTITSPTPAGFPARTTQTNSTGIYSFTNVPAGRNYTIKPAKTGYTFSPTTRSITNLSGNIGAGAATNFSGTQ